jgi:CHAT domain-containing protein
MATIHLQQGSVRTAITLLDRALAFGSDVTAVSRAVILVNQARLFTSIGDVERARASLASARAAVPEGKIYDLDGALAFATAEIDIRAEKLDEALTSADKALATAQRYGSQELVESAYTMRGDIFERSGRNEEALEAYRAAIAAGEQIRSAAGINSLKRSTAERSADAYERALHLLVVARRAREAFELTEHARARTLLDEMQGVALPPLRGISDSLRKDEVRIRRELATLEQRREAGAVVGLEIERQRAAYAEVQTRLQATDPMAAALRTANPLSAARIQEALSDDVTLISYFFTPTNQRAFVVTKKSLKMVHLPAGLQQLRDAVAVFRDFASRDQRPDTDWFFRNIVAPVLPLVGTKRLVIVPHDALHYIPFAALTEPSSGQWLGERFEIVYLPAASVLAYLPPRKEGNRLVAIGAPLVQGLSSLEASEPMLNRVAQAFASEAVLGANATETAFVTQAPDADILFVFAHARLQATAPLFSRIYFSRDERNDGALEVHEVTSMRLSGQLVVLGGCETQLGERSTGDDIVALNRAFMAAGAGAVLATLWRVPREPTEMLLEEFFGSIRAGTRPASALAAAQTAVRARYPHPYDWAGFVLSGKPD